MIPSSSPSACPKWTFGPGCSEECQCDQQNTVECHRRYGTCVCKAGYRGNTCKEGEHSHKAQVVFVSLSVFLLFITIIQIQNSETATSTGRARAIPKL